MTTITEQVHAKFKLFTGELAADQTIGALAQDVASWVKSARIAPKSIGVEYVESAERLVLSVGYRDDEAPYGVKLSSVSLGHIEELAPADLQKLEAAMAREAAKMKNVICHELYVTDDDTFVMVFMTHEE
jgi:hypothetical protein